MVDDKVMSKVDQFCHPVDRKEKDFVVFENVAAKECNTEHCNK